MRVWIVAILIVVGLASSVRCDDRSRVASLLKDARGDLTKIEDPDERLRVWISLAVTTARHGDKLRAAVDFVECKKFVRVSHENWREDGDLRMIAEGQAESGDFSGARRTAEAITAESVKDYALREILNAAERQKNLPECLKTVLACKGQKERDSLWESLAKDLAWDKDFENALLIAGKIESEESVASARVSIGLHAAVAGKISIAEEQAKLVKGHCSEDSLYDSIAEARIKAGDLAGARHDLKRALEIHAKRPPECRIFTFTTTIASLGDFDEAFRSLQQIREQSDRAHARTELIGILAAAGKIDRANELCRQLESSYQRSQALMNIALAQERAGDLSGARQTLAPIRRCAELGGDVLLNVAKIQRRLKDEKRAVIRVQEALQDTIEDSDHGVWRVRRLAEIAQTQLEMGNSAGAANTFRLAFEAALNLPEKREISEAIADDVARPQAQLLDPEEITAAVGRIADPLTRAKGRIGIAQGLLDRKK